MARRDSIVSITGATLSDNTAGSSPGNGGGVHVTDLVGDGSSTFSITDSMVTGNSAASEGGGLWNDAGGMMFIAGTTISGNTASGASSTNGGGGVFNNGGQVFIAADTSGTGSSISGNLANGAAGSGGGIFNDADGILEVLNSSITANSANRAGGGIEVADGTNTLLTNVTLDNNVATGMGSGPGNGGGLHITGGGTVQISGGTVSGNSAANEGGGLWNSADGTLTVGNDTPSGSTDPFINEATGTMSGDIQSTVDDFRNSLGTLNDNNPGSVGDGYRQINWDGVPDSVSAPNAFPGDFFNAPTSGRARGVEFTTPGTGFQVSATAASMNGVRFDNINNTYSTDFSTFSAERLFTPIGSNVTVVNFFVPGTNTPATVTGFGAVFTDVDLANTTKLEFFDKDGNLLATRNVLATPGDGSQSFTGVSFLDPIIAQVRITTGNSALGAGINDGAGTDLVVMDDFIFGEPIAIPTANPVIDGNIASGASASNGGGGIL